MTVVYPNPLPLKLRILHALTNALKTISPTTGYQSDLSDFDPGDGEMTSRVYRGRMWFGESDPLPMVSILESTVPGESVAEPPSHVPSIEYDWPLMIQGFVADDKNNPTDPGYILMADVRQLLATEATRKVFNDTLILGFPSTQVIQLKIGTGTVRPADDVSAYAYFWLELEIRIFDRALKPYAID